MQHFGFMGRAAVTAALLIGSAGLATAGSPHDTQGHHQSEAPGMKPGDLVRIRSGGPLMTVNAINGDQIVTVWALEDAYKAVDLDTITLLLGMMIVVASLRLSGFFSIANAWVMAHAGRPLILLGAVVATSGVFSAFLVNDAICLVLTPLMLELTLALGRRPVPYLLAVAMASNVGSTATITGNPQNIMIGSFSHIPYTKFALVLGPVALIGLIVTVALIALFHRAEFAGTARLEAPRPKVDADRALMMRALLATLILIALFFAGILPAQ